MSKISIDPKRRGDPFYRYKMPPLELKISSHKGKVVTEIINADALAKSLHLNKENLMKMFSVELSTRVDKKLNYISGNFSIGELQNILDSFISNHLLCEKCQLPELTVYNSKSKAIKSKCRSCSHKTVIIPDRGKLLLYDEKLKKPEEAKEMPMFMTIEDIGALADAEIARKKKKKDKKKKDKKERI